MKKWSIPNLGPVVQVAYAVENIEDATNSWSELFDIGPVSYTHLRAHET